MTRAALLVALCLSLASCKAHHLFAPTCQRVVVQDTVGWFTVTIGDSQSRTPILGEPRTECARRTRFTASLTGASHGND